jgi:hypothetical protein
MLSNQQNKMTSCELSALMQDDADAELPSVSRHR